MYDKVDRFYHESKREVSKHIDTLETELDTLIHYYSVDFQVREGRKTEHTVARISNRMY